MLPNIEVIVGTYTDFLLGYQLIQKKVHGEDKIQLKATFADKSHAGSLKCVAVQGPWIASGGSDDRIFIYDMRTRKQSHILHSHSGTINAVVFSPDLTHLLSASADGHLMATRVGSWTTEGDWRKAHAGNPVTHIACHPSSRLALSLGGDQILNTWNLVKGRVAYRTNLKSKRTLGSSPDCLSWSADGKHFTLSGPLVLEIWNIESASVVRSTKTPSKPICVTWLNELTCLVGLENGNIAWISLDADDDETPTLIEAHETRVKAMSYLNEHLVTISSAGEIKIWSPDIDEKSLTQIASVNIDCRPTCLALLDLNQFGNVPKADHSGDPGKQQQPDSRNQPEEEQEEENRDMDLIKPRSFVSIEYEQDAAKKAGKSGKQNQKEDKDSDASDSSDQSDESENQTTNKNAKKKQMKVKQKPTAKSSKQDDHSESESENDSDSDDFDSSSSSENERRPRGRKVANKRKLNTSHKQGAKQTKKK
ncbi:p21-activated protein kinase-interacting protein 1-like [Drosophila innubila]|uniref:p21-activated protein kinase-interacting protein 1-like n=1 Tax=Drosophila innubila TaxID=198719 RepID=UPI00148D3D55|nr:p21-activated protein kinase-interacting protein 1-like [Drosophila innubila]